MKMRKNMLIAQYDCSPDTVPGHLTRRRKQWLQSEVGMVSRCPFVLSPLYMKHSVVSHNFSGYEVLSLL
jgi:hypothetical protein